LAQDGRMGGRQTPAVQTRGAVQSGGPLQVPIPLGIQIPASQAAAGPQSELKLHRPISAGTQSSCRQTSVPLHWLSVSQGGRTGGRHTPAAHINGAVQSSLTRQGVISFGTQTPPSQASSPEQSWLLLQRPISSGTQLFALQTKGSVHSSSVRHVPRAPGRQRPFLH
jgi:hypothetical protein